MERVQYLKMIPTDLLEILACPACRESLTVQANGLQCTACSRIYPVRDGIPILLVDQAMSQELEQVVPKTNIPPERP
jgi:uncharacterized protein